MEKKVRIKVEGLQPGTDEDAILITASGIYHFRKNKHYVHYEEFDEEGGIIRNTIKIAPGQIEIIKDGGIRADMVFDLMEETYAVYHTSFGNLKFRILTSQMSVTQDIDEIQVIMRYTLYEGGSRLSDNQLTIYINSGE